MESSGTEKRIQALFSELSLEDHTRVPRFAPLWTRAEASRPAHLFSRSIAVAAAVIVIAGASSFALWSRQSQTVLNIASLEIPAPQLNQLAVVVDPPRSQPAHPKRVVRRRQPGNSVITEAALLSRWQSPTQNFMQSPSSVTFDSLPQLNQSVKDLESFLPKNNDRIKESNQ